MTDKTLQSKLTAIRSGQYQATDFIIADAKDGDMAFGCTAPGPRTGCTLFKSKADYLEAMQAMSQSGLIDVLLMSASSGEQLHEQGLFEGSPVSPAVRLNDTTDIWLARGSCYRESYSVPFATADIAAVQPFCNLGLYSMTFSNDLEADLYSLEQYRAFRLAAREVKFEHFLEVFNPAMDVGIAASELGFYINDMIIKAVAGLTRADTPQFLKLQFNGARAMEELSSYDPSQLVVGILGGAKGTTRDTFELLVQAEAAGAKVALFGRKINLAEAPLELVRLMRACIETSMSASDAVRAYHYYLSEHHIEPLLSLEEDIKITDPVLMQ